MYDAFDRYLARETWFTGHDLEDREFNACLALVVDHPDFSPEKMGEYMTAHVGHDDKDGVYSKAIDRRIGEAYAIRDFLRQTGR